MGKEVKREGRKGRREAKGKREEWVREKTLQEPRGEAEKEEEK